MCGYVMIDEFPRESEIMLYGQHEYVVRVQTYMKKLRPDLRMSAVEISPSSEEIKLSEEIEQHRQVVPALFSVIPSHLRCRLNMDSNLKNYLESLEKERVNSENIGAMVMNCNPFTRGHKLKRWLIFSIYSLLKRIARIFHSRTDLPLSKLIVQIYKISGYYLPVNI